MKARVLALSSAVVALALAAAAVPAQAALDQGAAAPDFTAPAFLGGEPFTFKLEDALKKGPVVVYFFPAAFTKGCQIEAHLFAESADKFKAAGATIIGVTAGNTERLGEFSKDTNYCSGKFPLASDQNLAIAKSYKSQMAERPLSDRTSYVINKAHKVVMVYSDANPVDHVTKTLDAVNKLKAGG